MKLRAALTRSYKFNKIEAEISEVDVNASSKAKETLTSMFDSIAEVIDVKTDILKRWDQEVPSIKNNLSSKTSLKWQGSASSAQIKKLKTLNYNFNENDKVKLKSDKGKKYADELIKNVLKNSQNVINDEIFNEK